ncbi:MAG TPA: hypothetical protein VEX40_13085 [Mycobacterium sp.]|nr:hypothetical protein [Mycobacterium sp.]
MLTLRLTLDAELAQSQQMLHSQQEAGTTDAADENRDLHTDRD